jgi:hypothetical protein
MRSQKASSVDCSLIVRDRFFDFLPNKDVARSAYIQNIVNSGYVLCLRGHGNYSFCLFDALSSGRVPVLVASDCILPFDFLIDYRSLFPIVPLKQLHDLPRIVAEHYSQFSDAEWLELQYKLHRLYLDWLLPVELFLRGEPL